MQLLRFAVVSLGGATQDWRVFTTESKGVTVGTIRDWQRDGGVALLLVASVPLEQPPAVDQAGLVIVPDEPRRRAEEALELTADFVSVATGHARSIGSPGLPVALQAQSQEDRNWIGEQRDLASTGRGVAAGRFTVGLSESDLSQLVDRSDGVALMGEALAQAHLAGRYRELLRVFERAFATAGDRLVPLLARFLASRPGLGYSKTEVKRWIVRLRGPAVHADRHAGFLEADLRPVVDRMLLAAYDVLLNKQDWHSRDAGRRDAWTPSIGPLDTTGRWFVLQHSAATLAAQLYDAFGAYVLDQNAPTFELGDDCWPRKAPTTVTATQAEVAVVPAGRLAVHPAAGS